MTRLIGICGPSGSGKTTLAREVSRRHQLVHIRQDDYFVDEDHMPKITIDGELVPNWEGAESIDFDRLHTDLESLAQGYVTNVPVYDKREGTRSGDRKIKPSELVIVEGFLLYAQPHIRTLFSERIYLDAPAQVLKTRRFNRQRMLRPAYYDQAVVPHAKFFEHLQTPHATLSLDSTQKVHELANRIDEHLGLQAYYE